MRFNEITLLGGKIQTRQKRDTKTLRPESVDLCRQLLKELRHGQFSRPQPIPTLPYFGVMLGPPEWLRESLGPGDEVQGRFFCVWANDPDNPLEVNLLLPATNNDLAEDAELRACSTILVLSTVGGSESQKQDLQENVEAKVAELLEARPLLATALLPTEDLDMETIETAADFSTCFAAALLEE